MQRVLLVLAILLIGTLSSIASQYISNLTLHSTTAEAELTDRSFASTCTATPVEGYTADLTITLVASNYSRTAPQTFSTASVSISNGINGDGDPSVLGQTLFSSGAESGSVLVTFQGPKAKISGLGCTPLVKSSLLFKAKTNDNSTKLKVAVQAPSESNTVWNNARRLDNNTTGFTTHGASGTIHNKVIRDVDDAEGSTNGEVVFGSTDPSKGGYEVQVLIKVTNTAIINESEELSVVFTAS